MRAESHNTLLLNPNAEPDQDPAAAAHIVRYAAQPDRAFAIADLTPAYAHRARKVTRGLAMLNRRQILVQDEVQSDLPTEVWWFLHTPAQVIVSDDGRSATLSQGDKRLAARILAPAAAKFAVMQARPLPTSPNPDGQNHNDGLRKLAVHLTAVTDLRLAVQLVPLEPGATPPEPAPNIPALQAW